MTTPGPISRLPNKQILVVFLGYFECYEEMLHRKQILTFDLWVLSTQLVFTKLNKTKMVPTNAMGVRFPRETALSSGVTGSSSETGFRGFRLSI